MFLLHIVKVLCINYHFNILYVKGCVPGHESTTVKITDARWRPHKTPPPFPTHFPNANVMMEEESYSEEIHRPFDPTIEFPDTSKNKNKR